MTRRAFERRMNSIDGAQIGVVSGATMWSVMSKDMTLGRGENHTNGTGGDEKEGVLANALAVGITGTEARRWVSHGGKRGMIDTTRCSDEWQLGREVSS